MIIWTWIQEELLGMQWLSHLVSTGLIAMGIPLNSPAGGAIQFFLYDVIKITLLLCVLIFTISYIQSYFPPERSRHILSHFHGTGANVVAALLGTVTPFCSCSSIPLFMGFTRAGLPVGVTFSFLISSPMVDLGSFVLLTSIFGSKVAAVYVFLGLFLAVAGGILIEQLHMEHEVEEVGDAKLCREDMISPVTVSVRLSQAGAQMVDTFRSVCPYILLGVAIGAFIHNWIPQNMVEAVLGRDNPLSVILAVAAGVPIYADIFGTIPVAEALLAKGAELGTVIAFMMAVTTLSLPSLIMLRKVVKPRLLTTFIVICTAGMILIGYVFNLFHSVLLM